MIPIDIGNGQVEYVDFVITEDNILLPLNVQIINGGKEELLPPTRDISEDVDGANGEFYQETEFEPRSLQLEVVTNEGLSHNELFNLKRDIAKLLNPLSGTKSLVYMIEPTKKYMVDVASKIEVTTYPTWFQFTIPFIMYEPFAVSTHEKSLIGNGKIKNEGTFETGMIIEINGAITNPSVTIGSDILTYTGTIASGDILVIDTLKKTAKIGNNNAVHSFNGVFPLLLADTELNVVAGSNVKIKWRDKWL